jgi:hypothetical protein
MQFTFEELTALQNSLEQQYNELDEEIKSYQELRFDELGEVVDDDFAWGVAAGKRYAFSMAALEVQKLITQKCLDTASHKEATDDESL